MPTIKDIALAAGVSHATVSNVLNKKGNVSSEKIRLVEEAAKALGYRIDEQASLLRKGVTRTVALILPDIQKAKYSDLYVGILNELEKHNYSIRLFLTENIPHKEQTAINCAIAAKTCAIVTVTCMENAEKFYHIPSLEQTPILFLLRESGSVSFPCFSFDYAKAGEFLAGHAKADGVTKPLIFIGNTSYSTHTDFLRGIQKVYPDLPDTAITSLKYGELSLDTYLAFEKNKSFDCCITSDHEIADQICYISQSSVPTFTAPLYSLSSLRTLRDTRCNTLPLNYSRLGIDAAQSLISAIEHNTPLDSRIFSAANYCPLHHATVLSHAAPLKMLSLDSPTASALKCLISEFTQQTGISVELDTYPLHTIYQHIVSSKLSNYDILRLDVSGFDYMAPDLLTPLTEVDPHANQHFSSLLSGLADNYGYVDGTLYAFPFDISIQMLFYRKDLFENAMQTRSFYELTHHTLKVPSTFDEYNEVARFFTQKFRPDSPTVYGTSVFLNNPSSTAAEFLVRLLDLNGQAYDEHGYLHISSPEALQALTNYLESASCANPEHVDSWEYIAKNFANGQSAMAILFVNHAAKIMQIPGAIASNQTGFAAVPGFRPLLGGGTLGICSSSSRKEDAYRFIRWATGDDIAARLMRMGGISPCRSAYEYTEILNTYPWLDDFEKNLKLGSRKTIFSKPGIHLDIHNFEVNLGQLIIDAYHGKRSLEETIWRAQLLMEEIEKGRN